MKRYDFSDEDQYKNEETWYMSFAPMEGVEYSKAVEYGKSKYEEINKLHDEVGKKGEWAFGLALAAVGGVIGYHEKLNTGIALCLPSLAMFLGVMWYGMRAKLPGPRPTAFSIRGAIDRVEKTNCFEAWEAASLHCAVTGLEFVTAWKSQQIQNAARLLICGVAVLCVVTAMANIMWLSGLCSWLELSQQGAAAGK